MGNPRYFPKLVQIEMLRTTEISCFVWSLQLFENKTFDLLWLMLWPDQVQKFCKVFFIFTQLFLSVIDISTRSSAKNSCDSFGPDLLTFIGSYKLFWRSWLMLWASTSIHRIKMYGDIGSPWRIPLEGLKMSVLVPFTRTATELVQMQDIIRFTIF